MRVPRNFSIALAACSFLTGSLVASVHAAPNAPDAEARGKSQATPRPIAASSSVGLRTEPTTTNGTQPARATVAPTATHAASEGAIGPEEHARRLQAALRTLKSPEPAAIQEALLNLRELQGRAAAEGVAARLKVGLPPQLSELALEVLGGLNQPIAVPVLSELTLHRRWQIRAKAITALAGLRVRSSVSVLLYALDDPSPEVRSAAAKALGMVGDPRATPALEAALERGVDGALEGLAQLATNKQVAGILERAKSALTASGAALTVLITRPNLPAPTKLKVIDFVKTHDSQDEAAQLLALFRDKLERAGDRRLLAALASPPKAVVAKAEVTHAPATQVAAGRLPKAVR